MKNPPLKTEEKPGNRGMTGDRGKNENSRNSRTKASERSKGNNRDNVNISKKKSCLIISGGGFVRPEYIKPLLEVTGQGDDNIIDYVFACDRGIDHAERYGIVPDIALGDFDSVSEAGLAFVEDKGIAYERYPSHKDDTDTVIAVRRALEMGYAGIYIICAMGGRPDHAFANIQAAQYAAHAGAKVWIIDNGSRFIIFADSEVETEAEDNCALSVFSLTDRSTGVSVKGAEYELCDAVLTSDHPIGVSNEFIKNKATVSVENGCLMVVVTSKLLNDNDVD